MIEEAHRLQIALKVATLEVKVTLEICIVCFYTLVATFVFVAIERGDGEAALREAELEKVVISEP